MSDLQGKKILLGICGGIAAYKSLGLIRLLRKAGAEVQVLVTPAARDFIGVVTASALSEKPVLGELFDPKSGTWHHHVELGLWADLYLIAPLTASTLAKMASGQSDNLLLAVYLSARCPVWVAPAMDLDMWQHPSTQRNIRQLEEDGVRILEPDAGPLASGLSGKGRMQEPEALFEEIRAYFRLDLPLKGKKALVTLGPTQESLDPVRFISNHSSGKMGAEIARALLQAGAEVWVVAGPVQAGILPGGAHILPVQSARDMLDACLSVFDACDLAVLAAAVADYRPAQVEKEKIKKSGETLSIDLVKNPDIAATLGQKKKAGQFLMGFALETQNEEAHARGKLQSKNLDAIVLNSLRDPGVGFGLDTNTIRILDKENRDLRYETKSKKDVAHDLVRYLAERIS